MYNKQCSVSEILGYPQMDTVLPLLFPEEFIRMVPEDRLGEPLINLEETIRMPWGAPYVADLLVDAANAASDILRNHTYQLLPLWGVIDKDKKIGLNVHAGGKSSVCLMVKTFTDAEKKPAVIICPGGGYVSTAGVHEGTDLAERMEKAGYRPFILHYRVNTAWPAPQCDLALAIKYIRANAEKYSVDPENVMVMGSSAGGHVCAMEAAVYEELDSMLLEELKTVDQAAAAQYAGISARPDKVCLNYAAISFINPVSENSFRIISGGDESMRKKLSAELNVHEKYPKTFIWICQDDAMIKPETSEAFALALKEKHVPYKLCVYVSGGHGCGLAKGTPAERWISDMLDFIQE